MKMDMVNFTIRSLRPHLQRQLVDYERTKFQEILEETPSKYSTMCIYWNGWKHDISIFDILSSVSKNFGLSRKHFFLTSRIDITNLELFALCQELCQALFIPSCIK